MTTRCQEVSRMSDGFHQRDGAIACPHVTDYTGPDLISIGHRIRVNHDLFRSYFLAGHASCEVCKREVDLAENIRAHLRGEVAPGKTLSPRPIKMPSLTAGALGLPSTGFALKLTRGQPLSVNLEGRGVPAGARILYIGVMSMTPGMLATQLRQFAVTGEELAPTFVIVPVPSGDVELRYSDILSRILPSMTRELRCPPLPRHVVDGLKTLSKARNRSSHASADDMSEDEALAGLIAAIFGLHYVWFLEHWLKDTQGS